MANPKHLKILKQGVSAWNKWREENMGLNPVADLRGANLSGLNLYKAELTGTNLCRANLSRANLVRSHGILPLFNEADLTEARLDNAEFYDARFREANLKMASCTGTIFARSKFEGSSLEHTDFRLSNLFECNLSGAILTGVKLYGTARDDWIIKNVKCKYVYWDIEGEIRTPKDRDLRPGEFEKLYAQLPTIEYIFDNGMTPIDPLIMDRVVQAIRERNPEFDIKIDSINARGLAPSIKFTVQHEEHKEPALKEVRKRYEERINRLEAEKDHLYQLLGRAIDKAGDVKLITAGPGAIVATNGSTINIQQHIHNAIELHKAIADEPEESKSFAKVAKKTALDIIGSAIKDITKGKVKKAAEEIIELGKDLGPLFLKMAPAAYTFFKSMLQ